MKTYGELLRGRPGVGRAGSAICLEGARRHRDARRLCRRRRRASRFRRASAYHDACHLAHAQGVRREPRALLADDSRSHAGAARRAGHLLRQRRHLQPGRSPRWPPTLGHRKAAHIADAGGRHGRHVEPRLHPADPRSAARAPANPPQVIHIVELLDRVDTVRLRLTRQSRPSGRTLCLSASASSARSASCTMEASMIEIYDTTLRDGTQGEGDHLLGRRQAAHRRAARRLRRALHRGRLARLEPARTSSSSSRRSTARSAARGWRRSARRAARTSRVDARRPGAAAARRRHAGRHHLRQDLAAARPRGPADDAGREPRDDRATPCAS